MENESEHDALVRLQIERSTARQVEDILSDFKKDIDEHFRRLEDYLAIRPTNEQMENAMKQCIDEKPLVYKEDFYDLWIKAKDKFSEKSTGKARNWIETAKGIAWVMLILMGFLSIAGDGIQAIIRVVSGG